MATTLLFFPVTLRSSWARGAVSARASQKVLAGVDARIVCAARRTHEIERVANEINESGGSAIAATTDVTQESDLANVAQVAMSHFVQLDIWVNNAGGSPVQKPMLELPPAIALNLSAHPHHRGAAGVRAY